MTKKLNKLFRTTMRLSDKITKSICLIALIGISFLANANQDKLKQAQAAFDSQQFEKAVSLYKALEKVDGFEQQAVLGLAKVAFTRNELDEAEKYIELLIPENPQNAEYLYWAGRVAGKQAQSASIFSKLGYARDARKYFTQALEVDSKHYQSIIGLIRFHQQAPVMAGGDKALVPKLLKQLREIDSKQAFMIEAPILLEKKQFKEADTLFEEALREPSSIKLQQFKFDYAMLLSSYQRYEKALETMLSIDLNDKLAVANFATMRLYQLGKLAAESRSKLALGVENMRLYAAIPETEKTISGEWIEFRLAQLGYLQTGDDKYHQTINKLRENTSDDYLKSKISAFLSEID